MFAENHYIFTDAIPQAIQLINTIQNAKKNKGIVIVTETPDEAFNTLKSNFTTVLAAGGIVWNEYSELLMIFRKGKWDLPKGHVEKDESLETAAFAYEQLRDENEIEITTGALLLFKEAAALLTPPLKPLRLRRAPERMWFGEQFFQECFRDAFQVVVVFEKKREGQFNQQHAVVRRPTACGGF